MTLAKTYEPRATEGSLFELWQKSGAFSADPQSEAAPYVIMMPPPNVTGSLHMGHALTFTLQDILIRYARMSGRDTLWQPGTDHAGIATQMVVERMLGEEGSSRRVLGREKFLDRVWQWKAESGGTILGQLHRLGASADWPRERFTMDEGLSAAVRKVFIELYEQGLIYKDQRLVNWDPKLETAISDLEVQPTETKGKLWHLKYPLEDGSGHIIVATTRPETMLGDTGVAVHPDDERYRHLIGKNCILPLVGRPIPIVGDEYADPEAGSGAVKITPAHDFNDFDVGRRQNLEIINILDRQGRINENAPEKYQGLDRFDARKAVISDLELEGLLEKIEDHVHMVPFGDRGGVPIEPYLTEQWYVDAETLAKPAIEAVETGRTKFVPENWSKTYFEWMRNIQPWCISRQLWWGHRIPAWYGPDGEIFVAENEDLAKAKARVHYGEDRPLDQDPDVLDTWFSSALWPFSTIGWPEQTPELDKYYPGDVLVTGFDIIFFWVARMMMMGNKFMSQTPFHTVYVHALVRDEKGQKMSKSKGNVIDPLEIIDKYGADTLRFTLTSLNTPGRDVRLSEQRIAGYRNFVTKITNAYKFAEFKNIYPLKNEPNQLVPKHIFNQWIINEFQKLYKDVQTNYQNYYFHEVANQLYHFTWHSFCDWYIELSKNLLDSDEYREETTYAFHLIFNSLLQLLHPIIPFITEKLWSYNNQNILMTNQWNYQDIKIESQSIEAANNFIEFIEEYRSIEKLFDIKKEHEVLIYSSNENLQNLFLENQEVFEFLTRKKLSLNQLTNGVSLPFKNFDYEIKTNQIDKDKIIKKLTENSEALTKEKFGIDKNLNNQNFVEREIGRAHV